MLIDWQKVDTVLLDMDGTILDLHFDNYFWQTLVPKMYAEKSDKDAEQAMAEVFAMFDAAKGTLDWYCLDYWSEALDLDIIGMKQPLVDKIQFRPNAEAFLTFLNEHQKQVCLITNAHPKSLELKILNTQFHRYFTEIISSHQFKAPKETPEFWQRLEQHLPFDRKRSLFIDDTESVLKSAQEYGIEYNLGIAQPDSYMPAREMNGFVALEDFRQIM